MDDENNMNEDGELDNIVVLSDQDGKETPFEYVDSIEFEGEEYAVLLPIEDEEDDEDDGDIVILKVEDTEAEDGEETFVSVDDENTLKKVFEIFKEEYKDEFNFKDDEDEDK